jgi:tetratricopeptide (TPR) repeat protein
MFRISWALRRLGILLLMAMLVGATLTQQAAAEEQLSREQLASLRSEAEASFDRGVEQQAANPVDAKDAFALAAQKYQLIADAEPASGPLCFNLANAYLQSGQVGPAIANYLRAEKLMPGDRRVAAGLQAARTLAGTKDSASDQNFHDNLGRWNRTIPLGTRIWIGLAAWVVLWAALGAAILRPGRRWRVVWIPAFIVSAVAATSVGYERYQSPDPDRGVVVASQATVRQGNGEGFAPQFSQPLTAGTEFTVVDRRDEWTKITLADGRSGWVSNADVAVVD